MNNKDLETIQNTLFEASSKITNMYNDTENQKRYLDLKLKEIKDQVMTCAKMLEKCKEGTSSIEKEEIKLDAVNNSSRLEERVKALEEDLERVNKEVFS